MVIDFQKKLFTDSMFFLNQHECIKKLIISHASQINAREQRR